MAESNIDRNILTVSDPAIFLEEMSIPDAESETENAQADSKIPFSKIASLIPIIRINQYEIQGDRIRNLKLRNTGFYPTIKVSFFDRDSLFGARFYPKDGDIMQLYIASQGKEDTFKPIRIDFEIIGISSIGGGNVKANKYTVEGRMFIPTLFDEKNQILDSSSWDALFSISEELELGYASNVEDTIDIMKWINPNTTVENFVKDITLNSYSSDDSFFTSYIDPYYYLTFVDVNKLFDQTGTIEVSKQFFQNAGSFYKNSEGEEEDYPNFLSNLIQMQGTARYISKYTPRNETGSVSKKDGYRKYAQYWNIEDKEFINEYVEPITNDTPGYINATRGGVLSNNQNKLKYLGSQTENVHDEFLFSSILNNQNLNECKKLGMTIDLDMFNPALVRYSRIYCAIYEYGIPQQAALLNSSLNENSSPPSNTQNRDISATDEPSDYSQPLLNEHLSGFYVISGIEYIMTNPGPLRMRLHLQRKEYIPTT